LSDWLQCRYGEYQNNWSEILGEIYANTASFTEQNAEQVIETLKSKSVQRDLIEIGHKLIAMAADTENPMESMAQAEQMIFDAGKERGDEDFKPIFETVYVTLEKIKNIQKKISGVPTGIWGLDKILGGLQKRDVVFLAGRPSSGKSALMQSIAASAAVNGYPVGIISIESPIDTMNQRYMSAASGVNLLRLKNKWMDAEEWKAVEAAIGPLANLPIYQKHARRIGTSQIKSIARRMKNSVGIELLCIDYAQLIKPTQIKGMTKADALEEVSGEIKDLADELNVPVLLLGQIKRKDPMLAGKGKMQNFRPRLDELKGTGAYEQDSDVVLLLHRESFYHPEDATLVGQAELEIAKQRQGPKGHLDISFDEKTTRFYQVEPTQEQAAMW
jgi:replicative DNA helicase